ncbi:MAG: histidinol-phosphatase, partial [Candidatus Methanomethylicota archaeon]
MENYSLIDLHVHSHLSDGLNSPLELAFRAKKIGLNGIAIVDHA